MLKTINQKNVLDSGGGRRRVALVRVVREALSQEAMIGQDSNIEKENSR